MPSPSESLNKLSFKPRDFVNSETSPLIEPILSVKKLRISLSEVNVCFIPDKTHYPFLKRHLNLKSGLIKNISGEVMGQHEGLSLYTLGQRQGIKIGGIGPFYVVKLDYKTNTLVVSNKKDDPKLYTKKFYIKESNWIIGQPKWPFNCQVKIRYQAPSVKCQINKNKIILTKPQRAIMPGQSAVFYAGRKLLGGAIIDPAPFLRHQ